MNLSKAWDTKLEAASFLLSKILYKQCDISEVTYCLSILYLLRLNFNLVSLNLGQSDLGVLYCNLDSVV